MRKWLPFLALPLVAGTCKSKPPDPMYSWEPARAAYEGEGYSSVTESSFASPMEQPLSTFSVDVDTASYSNVRRFLQDGQAPPADAVRIEELLNTFEYDDPAPEDGAPFAVRAEVADCPWAPGHQLVRLGLQARRVPMEQVPPLNLVFLVDTSGSMDEPNKLPLLVASLRMLVHELRPQDQVAIVTYAGSSALALPSTPGDRKQEIVAALNGLGAAGTTNGAGGIQLAYEVARQARTEGGISRVLLATDGDFNVGLTSLQELEALISRERDGGVFLTVLGLGTGNLQDDTMELLADKGDGAYAYLDTLSEARRVLVEQATGTLLTVARDVKVQVEFNPREVSSYRLIGYDNRLLAARDFNDTQTDAGEIGAGHHVTALYEIVPPGAAAIPGVDPLRYQAAPAPQGPTAALSPAAESGELMQVKVRYKTPESGDDQPLVFPVLAGSQPVAHASESWRWAAAVAAWGMLLRDSAYRGEADWALVRELASGARGLDPDGYRAEFLRLVELSATLTPSPGG